MLEELVSGGAYLKMNYLNKFYGFIAQQMILFSG